jgi:polar amino acid transport system permease protein
MLETIAAKWAITVNLWPILMSGLWLTFTVSMLAIVLGSVLGFGLGTLRTLPYRWPRALIGGYLHIFRGSPFLVQLYIIYFVLPSLDIWWLKFDSFTAAIVALSLYTSSYVTEITAAAIRAVPSGQEEAARAAGMSKFEALFHVVFPQALRLMIPPMAGVYVVIIKSTSLLSVIGISELTRQGEIAMLRLPGNVLFVYCLIALVYFAYCYPVLRFSQWGERRFGRID